LEIAASAPSIALGIMIKTKNLKEKEY